MQAAIVAAVPGMVLVGAVLMRAVRLGLMVPPIRTRASCGIRQDERTARKEEQAEHGQHAANQRSKGP